VKYTIKISDDRRVPQVNSIRYDLFHHGTPIRLKCEFLFYTHTKQSGSFYHPCPTSTRLFMLSGGYCRIQTSVSTRRLVPGRIYLVPSRQPFRVVYSEAQLYAFHIRCVDSHNISVSNELTGTPSLRNGRHLFDSITHSLDEGQIYICQQYAFLALLQFFEPIMDRLKDRIHQFKKYKDVIEMISKNPTMRLKINDLASSMNTCRTALSTGFHREVGIPLKQYILQSILDKAKILLETTDQKVETIAEELGFQNTEYFYKFFKRHGKLTPNRYRQITQFI
jgi:AraC-like DNA-binding protein